MISKNIFFVIAVDLFEIGPLDVVYAAAVGCLLGRVEEIGRYRDSTFITAQEGMAGAGELTTKALVRVSAAKSAHSGGVA